MTTEAKREYMRKYYLENKESMKKQSKNWAINNNDRQRELVINHLKKTNYAIEKTEKQRYIRNIKRKTRYHFPLTNKTKCELCGCGAECHHHNTSPIKVDKFNLFCNTCHNGVHTQLNLKEVKQNGKFKRIRTGI